MKKVTITLLIIVVLGIIYLIMFFNTNSIIREVEDVMRGNVDSSVTEGTPLQRYNYNDVYKNAVVNVNITRLFTFHNFFDGYMWVKYSVETVKNDNDIFPSSSNIISRWKIHRKNGKWEIVEISEAP